MRGTLPTRACRQTETVTMMDAANYHLYAGLCQEVGLPITEAGYWQWRRMIKRLTSEPDLGWNVHEIEVAMSAFASAMQSVVPSIVQLGAAFQELGSAMALAADDSVRASQRLAAIRGTR